MSKKSKPSKAPKKLDDKNEQNSPSSLPGWPGYRTREGRSGYDPIDTRTEAGHMAGSILRSLFAGPVRNPVHLVLLGGLGVILILPLILAMIEMLNGNLFPWSAWVFLLITGILGFAILNNFIKNLISRRK